MEAVEYMKLNPIVKYTPKILKQQDEEVLSDDSDLDNTQTQFVADPIRDKKAQQLDASRLSHASKKSSRDTPLSPRAITAEDLMKVKPGVHTRFDQFAPRPRGNPDKYK